MVMLARLAVLLLVLGTPASAAPVVESKSEPRWLLIVRPECERFVPPARVDHPLHWDHWLSLASCIQDASRKPVDDPSDVPEMWSELARAMMPAMLMWRDALGYAPARVQVHASFQVGLAAVALMTRARSSLVAGPNHAVLLERLEGLLAPTKSLAWTAFKAVDNEAAQDPSFESDPVNHAMASSARTMLRVLDPPLDPKIQLAGPAR